MDIGSDIFDERPSGRRQSWLHVALIVLFLIGLALGALQLEAALG